MYGNISESDLRQALQFWEPGESIDLCVSKKEYLPYLRHNVIAMVGQPDRVIGDLLYYNRVPIRLHCMEGRPDPVPDGSYYIGSNISDTVLEYGYCFYIEGMKLQIATLNIAQGKFVDVVSMMKK